MIKNLKVHITLEEDYLYNNLHFDKEVITTS